MTGVVVTGIGIHCAGSPDAQTFWDNVTAGRSAVKEVVGVDVDECPCQVGGQIESIPASGFGDPDDRMLQLLVGVAGEALEHSGSKHDDVERDRMGVYLGQCQGSFDDGDSVHFMHSRVDALAAYLGMTGPRSVVSTACAAGASAIALAAERIVADEADVMLAGGLDVLSSFTWRGFTSLQSLSPAGCAAYSRSDGLVLGEGAALFVLEREDRVARQGRTPLAELLGWGSSADAYHITAPDPSAQGAVLAMTRAVNRAGVAFDDVGYVCGHGTGTKPNDEMEVKGLRLAFGDRAPEVPLSSIKPMIGHTLGAAGAIEAAATVFALRDGMLPPTVNFEPAAPSDLDFVANVSRPARLEVAMSNNYAFGGNNSSLVFARPGRRNGASAPPAPVREVCVTGIGMLGAVGSGYAIWRDALLEGRTGLAAFERLQPDGTGISIGAELPELSSRGVASPADWRHLDPLSRLALTVSRQAWQDAKLELTPAERANVAVIYGSGTGPVSAIRRFQESTDEGHPSPLHFPNTVFTAAPGHVCRALGVRGPTTTFTSGGLAATHAIEYATKLVASSEVDVAIVVAAEELSEWHLSAGGGQRRFLAAGRGIPFQRTSEGVNLGAAGVALVLEPAGRAAARGATSYGRILGCAVGGDATGSLLPDPSGTRWSELLAVALRRAGVEPVDVGYVACTASGVPELDSLETGVISRVLGKHVPVSSPKGITGETIGASGAVSLVTALAALEASAAPPTADLTDPIGGGRVRHVMHEPLPLEREVAVADSFSLGGNYGWMVVAR